MGEATRMFWKDRLPPCQSVPYLLLKMAALASREADALLPIECTTPLGGRIRSQTAIVGPSRARGSSFPDKGQFLSTTTSPPCRAGSSLVECLPSSGLHWMTCVPTRQRHSQPNSSNKKNSFEMFVKFECRVSR